jgi:ribosomal protein L7/L12
MRSRFLLFVLILGVMLSSAALFAAEAASLIPVYPGSKVEFELNLTQKDFLPVIRQWIGLIPGVVGKIMATPEPGQQPDPAMQQALVAGALAAQQVQAALAGVNQISVIAYTQPKNVSADKIADFYIQKMALGKGWVRPFMVQRPEGSAQLYVKPDFAGMFGIGVGKGYVVAAKVDGKIDLVMLGRIFAELAPMIGMRSGINTGGEPTQDGSVEPQAPAQAGYQVTLEDVGPQRVRVLAIIREVTGMSPTDAREFVNSLPKPLATGLSEADAQELAKRLESIGATVSVANSQ